MGSYEVYSQGSSGRYDLQEAFRISLGGRLQKVERGRERIVMDVAGFGSLKLPFKPRRLTAHHEVSWDIKRRNRSML